MMLGHFLCFGKSSAASLKSTCMIPSHSELFCFVLFHSLKIVLCDGSSLLCAFLGADEGFGGTVGFSKHLLKS